nr:PREDICTED: disease resistance protein RGA2-like [Musa acuminata subsp. malaccensis]
MDKAMADSVISWLIGMLMDKAKEKVDSWLGVPEDIKKLRRTLRSFQSVLDAENRRIEDKAVNDWLMELKDVLYDADDLLDEWRAEKCTPGEPPLKRVKRNISSISFRNVVGNKIKDLNDRLEEINFLESKGFFLLVLFCFSLFLHPQQVPQVSRITSPTMKSDMVGEQLEDDAMALMKQLTKQDPSKNVVVLAIVGIGGIGKTTLAKKVFNDGKIKASFRTTIWVCVSQKFSETDLLRNIVTGAGGSHGGEQSRSQLEPAVERLLRGNKFLLVLDDVWGAQIWDDLLRNPLQGGAAGSRVLVTTRNAGIARQMKAAHVHEMKLLPPEDGWSLLCKKVTTNAEDERDAQDLKDTGMKIVEKCGGLPLAITTDIQHIVNLTKRHESVRTLLVEGSRGIVGDVDDSLKNLVRLRVLHLMHTNIESISHYIGNLIHLRYLDVSHSHITELPESICNLTNLQFLILKGCFKLRQIPQGIDRLLNLRTLDCKDTDLESLPCGIGRLKHLNELVGFVMDTPTGSCPLEELGSLQELRYLSVDRLGRAWLEAEPGRDTSVLKGNHKLKNLHLHCLSTLTSDCHTEEEIERMEKVLDVALHPPSSVVSLSLDGFGLRYPSWMASASISSLLPNIRRLELIYCLHWPLLPPLGKLPSLEFLEIVGADAVTTIGPEFFGCEVAATGHDRERNSKLPSSSSPPPPPSLFPKLRQLELWNMTNMEVWDWVAEGFAMRRLDKLVLENCPKLKSLPEGLIRQATCLTTLDLSDVCALKSIRGFPSVKELSTSGESDLEIVADLPALEFLNLGTYRRRNNHLPEWLAQQSFTTLQRLDVRGTTQILRRCLQNGADWPMIERFPKFSIEDGRGNYINYIKHSCTFDTNLVDDDAVFAAVAAEEEEEEEEEEVNEL